MTTENKTSVRGIPFSEVIEDVASYLTSKKLSPEEAETETRDKYGKYKYVEQSMQQQKARMEEKLPEFKNSLALIDTLIEKNKKNEEFDTTFLLSDDIYTKARVKNLEKVSIWLGANVMVEYEIDKAKDLLLKNQASVQKVVDELISELAFIKDQITTTEVNLANIINHRVLLNKTAAASK